MKNIFRLLQLSAIVLASVGCSDTFENEGVDTSTDLSRRATLTITGSPKSRVAFEYEDGVGVKTRWEAGDQISVFSADGAEHLVDFDLTGAVAADGTATFVAENNHFAFAEDATYKVVYPATETYSATKTFVEMTQSVSGDATHLDGNLIMAGDYTFKATENPAITLTSQQSVVKATIKNLTIWRPKKVVYSIGSQSVTVNLTEYESGDAVVLIPSNPQASGAIPTFSVTYDDGEGNAESVKNDFAIPALTKDHIAGKVYKLDLDMGNGASSATAGDATAESNDTEIIIPVGMAMDVANKDGFSISVSNGDFEGAQAISIASAAADGDNIVLTLNSPIFSDDVVTISFDGSGVSAGGGSTTLEAFTDKSVAVEGADITDPAAVGLHDFEDGGSKNSYSNLKDFYISSDDHNGGSKSLRYSYDNSKEKSNQASTKAVAASCYIGNKTGNTLPIEFTVGDSYIVLFDFKPLEVTDLTGKFNLRVKAGTTNGQSASLVDFGTISDSTINKWNLVEKEITITTNGGFTKGDTYLSNLAFVSPMVSNETNANGKYITPVDAEFYIDNIRIYNKSDYYRSAKATAE